MLELFRFLFNKNTQFHSFNEQRDYELTHEIRKETIRVNHLRSF